MKATGIVRKIDSLGRLVLPIELRRMMGIEQEDPIEIFVEGEMMLLKRYAPACIFCGEAGDLVTFRGKKICMGCLKELEQGKDLTP